MTRGTLHIDRFWEELKNRGTVHYPETITLSKEDFIAAYKVMQDVELCDLTGDTFCPDNPGDCCEICQRHGTDDTLTFSPSWEFDRSFYPNYSSACEKEAKAFLVSIGFDNHSLYGDCESLDGQWKLVYVSSGHERDSSGDHVDLYRKVR